MKRTIAFMLVWPITGLAIADTLIFPKDRSVDKSGEKNPLIFSGQKEGQVYELNDPRLLLKKLRPIVVEPYPQQIVAPEPKIFPRYRQKNRPHRGYNN